MESDLKKIIEEELKSNDRFADASEWLFTICHVIHHKHGLFSVPEHWGYTPSPMGTHIDLDEFDLISFHSLYSFRLADLLKAGENLIKFIEILKELGETY